MFRDNWSTRRSHLLLSTINIRVYFLFDLIHVHEFYYPAISINEIDKLTVVVVNRYVNYIFFFLTPLDYNTVGVNKEFLC